jgi:hypothetical protein
MIRVLIGGGVVVGLLLWALWRAVRNDDPDRITAAQRALFRAYLDAAAEGRSADAMRAYDAYHAHAREHGYRLTRAERGVA